MAEIAKINNPPWPKIDYFLKIKKYMQFKTKHSNNI